MTRRKMTEPRAPSCCLKGLWPGGHFVHHLGSDYQAQEQRSGDQTYHITSYNVWKNVLHTFMFAVILCVSNSLFTKFTSADVEKKATDSAKPLQRFWNVHVVMAAWCGLVYIELYGFLQIYISPIRVKNMKSANNRGIYLGKILITGSFSDALFHSYKVRYFNTEL